MASQRRRRRRRRQRLILAMAVILLIIIVAGITVGTTLIRKYTPSKEVSDYKEFYQLEEDDSVFVVFDNERMEYNGIVSDGEAYVDYRTVHNYLNSRFYWDSTEQILRYTLPEGLVNVSVGETNYMVGRENYRMEHPIVLTRDGNMYLSMSFIKQYTDIRYELDTDPGRVVISDQWGELGFTKVKSKTQIREKGGIKSPILKEIDKDELVTVLETGDKWDKVCSQDGFIGYIRNSRLGGEQTVLYDDSFTEPAFPHLTRDFRINMAWHQVTNAAANGRVSEVLARTKGVNVISPTWFYLDDNEGGIATLADTAYVTYCHQQNVEVWGLISNLENPQVNTTEVLSVTSKRDNLVNNIISEAIRYGLDGINVDFESLEGAAGEGYLQFIRELSLMCDNNNLVLSVDNYVPSEYTKFYSRGEQAVFADYVVLMAYDEHFNGSAEGSVASIGFVSQGVADAIQEEVPASQLILGIPFYTRLWKLTPDAAAESGYTVTSETLGMSETEAEVAANNATLEWQEENGQYYTEYQKDGSTWKIWVEDQNSIEQKLQVMQSNDLAGAAFWKLGYEKNTIWDTIIKFMQ